MPVLHFRLLGIPEVRLADQSLVFKTRKTLALFACLATESTPRPRDELATLLWPNHPLEEARSNLRTTLHHLRQSLGSAAEDILLANREALGLLSLAQLDVDLRSLSEAQRLSRLRVHPPGLRRQLEEAVEMYRGPFLDGLYIQDAPDFEIWVDEQRGHWLRVVTELLERLSDLQKADGDAGAALSSLERWADLDGGAEKVWQQLIELHLENDATARARRTWEACRKALAKLGAQPGDALSSLAEQIESGSLGARAPFPLESSRGVSPISLDKGPLVGRSNEFQFLRQMLEEAQRDGVRVVILEGEAGIGKTRLANEFIAWAGKQDVDVLVGRALEASGYLPFAPVVEALRVRLERENAPDDLLDDLWLAELARLLPELRTRYPDLPSETLDPPLADARLFEAVAQLGQSLAQRHPILVFIDDARWTDVATRDLFRYLLRRWAEGRTPILVLLAVNSASFGTDRQLAQWMGELERDATARRLTLDRLPTEAIIEWVAALGRASAEDETIDTDREEVKRFGEWLAQKADRHPFYTVQTVRALLEEGLIHLHATSDGAWGLDFRGALSAGSRDRLETLVPSGVRTLVQESVQRLNEGAADLLSAGAVLGDSFTEDQLYQVAGVDESTGLRRLEEVLRARLLREEANVGSYAFAHELVRAAVLEEASAARLHMFHRRALEVQEAANAPASELARHALAAGLHEKTLNYCIAAGDAALHALAIQDAITHYERACNLLAHLGRDNGKSISRDELGKLYTHLGRAYELNHEPERARATYEALRTLARDRGASQLEIAASRSPH